MRAKDDIGSAGWYDRDQDEVYDVGETRGEIGDPSSGNGGYGTDACVWDTDGDTISDGTEANGQVIRYANDDGDGRGYLFSLTSSGSNEKEFKYHTNPLKQDTDNDGQPDNKDLIPLDYDMDGDGMINSLDLVDSNSGNYDIRVADCIANDRNLQRNTDGSYVADADTDGDGILNINDADTDNDGMSDLYEMNHGVANGGWQNPYVFNARYALLLAGGGIYNLNYPKIKDDMEFNFPAMWNDIYELYGKLTWDYNYHEENVYLLYSPWLVKNDPRYVSELWGEDSKVFVTVDGEEKGEAIFSSPYWGHHIQVRITNEYRSETFEHTADNSYMDRTTLYITKTEWPEGSGFNTFKMQFTDYRWEDFSSNNPQIDGEMEKVTIESSIESIGDMTTANDFIFLGLNTHGSVGGFLMNQKHITTIEEYQNFGYSPTDFFSYKEFGEFINNTFGGEGITPQKYAVMTVVNQACHSGAMMPHLAGNNRILISAAKSSELSYTEADIYDHDAFLHEGRHLVYASDWSIYKDERLPGFTPSLGDVIHPNAILYAFWNGHEASQSNYIDIYNMHYAKDWRSSPQIDDNFNGLTVEDGDNSDGFYAYKIYL